MPARGLGAGEELPLFLPTPSFMASADEGVGCTFFCFFLLSLTLFWLLFLCRKPLVRISSSWGRPGRRAYGSLQRAATARTAGRKRTIHTLANDLSRSHVSND